MATAASTKALSLRALFLGALVALLMLSGCSSGSSSTSSLAVLNLDNDDVLVMGKVSRIPSYLAADLKHETHTDMPPHSDKVTLWFKDYHRDPNVVARSKETASLTTSWDTPFEFVTPKKALILNRIEVYSMSHGEPTSQHFTLPETYTYLVRVDDQALYVGNLRLYTNEFDEVTAVELVDESLAIQGRMAALIDHAVRFRVSLLKPQ
ncbi:hypothetical protein L4D15_11220 [Enterovibrio norvegicus]|uniref:hypothetical protein n=1 Tax=Enterovibrio norvegicus TaxID=188144 RepID=UPI003D15020C